MPTNMSYYILSFLVLCLSLEMIPLIQKIENIQVAYRSLSAEIEAIKSSNRHSPHVVSAFSVSEPRSVTSYDSDYTLHNFAKVHINAGEDFSAETGIFKCTKRGVYYFTASLIKKRSIDKESNGVDYVHCKIYKNTKDVLDIIVDPTEGHAHHTGSAAVSNSIVLQLEINDVVFLGGCDNPMVSLEGWSSFSGFLLYPD